MHARRRVRPQRGTVRMPRRARWVRRRLDEGGSLAGKVKHARVAHRPCRHRSPDRPARPGSPRRRRVSAMRSCGRLGPARLGTTVDRSSSSVSEKIGSGASRLVEQPLLPAVGLDEGDLLLRAARELAGSAASRRRRGRCRRSRRTPGAMLAIVARSATPGSRARRRRTRRTCRPRRARAGSG